MTHFLVTGANGFVGKALCRLLLEHGHQVTGLVRRPGMCAEGVHEWVHDAPDFDGLASVWPDTLRPAVVIHLAARVHVMRDTAVDRDAAFRATNVDGTMRVAQAARQRGVSSFVYLSSIKAVAESDGGKPLSEETPPMPEDPYGRSKLEAERALATLRDAGAFDVVVVRPPLVYGPGVGANFLSLINVVWRGVPLPLGSVAGRRSLIYVVNLADALMQAGLDKRAANQCFHVADAEDLTVPELLVRVGEQLGRSTRLFSLPDWLLRFAARITGRSEQIRRLTDDLRVDSTCFRTVLGWRPPYSVDDGLAATARWYLTTHS
ncbi:UDP-glucose 4-epimerase [Paraburkholderia unamae]|uniref:UDP-glucose 4-epimerase family protein n=1 Tax=Paraburkholderia unamae TaxID=219649 RepID=UPI000DC27DEC|nr:SDR family oxidoreductase [Paraburkholderia unamae]RAR60625.1 UDP-glucose 4-epimerase [Paraburkholderia unamae]